MNENVSAKATRYIPKCKKISVKRKPNQGIIQKKYGRISFMQNKTDVPKARKMAAGGLGSAVSPPRVAKPPKSFDFFV